MLDKSTSKRVGILASLTIAAMTTATLTVATPAAAQVVDFEHSLALAEQQSALSQRMAKEVILIALGYNKNENLRNLEFNHEQFARILNGLRYGDIELALPPTSDPEIMEHLERVSEIWPLFDGAVQEAVHSGSISNGQVRLVADMSRPLLAAVGEVIETYEDQAQRNQLFSMLTVAIEQSGHAGMLSQLMAKDYFLIAFGYQTQRNREELRASMQEFELVISGLTSGDLDRMLLPAPTPQIQGHLRTVQRLWQDMREPLNRAVAGDDIDEDSISIVASINLNLLQQLFAIEGMYEAL